MDKVLMDELLELRDEVYELREKLKAYEDGQAAAIQALCKKWRITMFQARTLLAMSTGRVMTREQLLALTGRVEEGTERNVDSAMKRLRARKIPGVEIKSLYGVGYYVAPESVGVIKAAVGEH